MFGYWWGGLCVCFYCIYRRVRVLLYSINMWKITSGVIWVFTEYVLNVGLIWCPLVERSKIASQVMGNGFFTVNMNVQNVKSSGYMTNITSQYIMENSTDNNTIIASIWILILFARVVYYFYSCMRALITSKVQENCLQ